MSSGLKTENSDNPKKRGRQRDLSDNAVGNRILEALGGRSRKWLADKSGISESTVSDYIIKGIAKSDAAVAFANALDVSIDWLLTGRAQANQVGLVDVDDADWVNVPRYDLRDLTDEGRGPAIDETPFRRDWLNRTLAMSSGLWLTTAPADYEATSISEGDLLFVRDVAQGEATDRALYIVRIDGTLTIARLNAFAGTGLHADRVGETMISFRHFGNAEGQAVPVARIMGVPLMRI